MTTIPRDFSRSFFSTLFTMGLGGALATGAGASTPIDRHIPAGSSGVVRIENISGRVVVEGTDAAEVEIAGELGDGVKELRVESKEGAIEIEVVLPRNAKNVEDSDLFVKVPRASSLHVETVSASIRVVGVSGGHEIESVSGAIDLEGGSKRLDVESVSGRIRLRAVDGELEVSSVSGSAEIVECSGSLEAETTSGKMQIAGCQLEKASVTTLSGALDFDADLADGGTFELESTSGRIRADLSAQENVAVSVESFSGSISTDFDAKIGEASVGPGKHCEFTIGEGSARMRITNLSGSVAVGKRIARS